MIKGNFGDLIDPAIRKVFDDRYKMHPEQYSQVFQVMESDRHQELLSSIGSLGLANDVSEGAEIPYVDADQGFKATFTHGKVALGIQISQELLEDDLFSEVRLRSEALADAVRQKVETDAASVFNNGFSGGSSGPDGAQLFSASHVREDGGSSSESNTTTLALSDANLDTVLVNFQDTTGTKGETINLYPDLMVVPIELETTARVLLDSEGRTGTTNNDINVWRGSFDLFVWQYLTDNNNWFLLDRRNNPLHWFWRRKVAIKRDDKISSEIARWYAAARYSQGWRTWRGVYGVQGA